MVAPADLVLGRKILRELVLCVRAFPDSRLFLSSSGRQRQHPRGAGGHSNRRYAGCPCHDPSPTGVRGGTCSVPSIEPPAKFCSADHSNVTARAIREATPVRQAKPMGREARKKKAARQPARGPRLKTPPF